MKTDMKKVIITASVALSVTLSGASAFAATEDVNYTPIPVKDANGNVIAQTTSIQLGADNVLPFSDVHDANGNVIGQTRDVPPVVESTHEQKPQDSFGGLHYVLVVDGKSIGVGSDVAYTNGDQLMVPLRAVSEALGYNVEWNQEKYSSDVTQGAVWSGVQIGKDNYAFGKMAPRELGAAPELKNDTTFVPVSFFTDILKHKMQMDETGVIKITKQ
ncbi:copper amine oxidase N-terminal domain-containing protein [Paenibacillus sp. UNC451MF]|uniref:copper amine oxidase N-terminal domain-containing protein n=1 Tax=Paenibacillus sp. UNC451MF TaxID=1449063 RepID=UPI00048F3AAD|nr:copper amine oxidase N-terminal domain-containing protein [Paenibacillus sp. UNC451MF]